MQYFFIVRWSYVEHCCVFTTLEAAQACAHHDNFELTWEHFVTDMRGVEMWESSSYPLHISGTGRVTITKYPLDQLPDSLL